MCLISYLEWAACREARPGSRTESEHEISSILHVAARGATGGKHRAGVGSLSTQLRVRQPLVMVDSEWYHTSWGYAPPLGNVSDRDATHYGDPTHCAQSAQKIMLEIVDLSN